MDAILALRQDVINVLAAGRDPGFGGRTQFRR